MALSTSWDDAEIPDGFATFAHECATTAATCRPASASTPPGVPRDGRVPSHRWVLVHMIEEYARHNGHADLLRERIDRTVGD